MSKRQSISYAAGAESLSGEAPPQYLQDTNQPAQSQSSTPYGQPGNINPPQQTYTYGQYAGGAPQSQPYGATPPVKSYNSAQNQGGVYPPPANGYFPPAGKHDPTLKLDLRIGRLTFCLSGDRTRHGRLIRRRPSFQCRLLRSSQSPSTV